MKFLPKKDWGVPLKNDIIQILPIWPPKKYKFQNSKSSLLQEKKNILW